MLPEYIKALGTNVLGTLLFCVVSLMEFFVSFDKLSYESGRFFAVVCNAKCRFGHNTGIAAYDNTSGKSSC